MQSEPCLRVFVGGLNFETDEDMIHLYFESQGAQVVSVLVLRENNKSKGFGFVTFYDQEGVKIAITKKHIIQGRVISCKIATPKLPSSSMTKMFVGGLPLNVCEADLEHYFQQWRAVDRCSVIVNPQTGRSRGFGFVTFYDEESINYVLQFNHYIGGKHVEVKVAKPNTQDKDKEAQASVPQPANVDKLDAQPERAENAGRELHEDGQPANPSPTSNGTLAPTSASPSPPAKKHTDINKTKIFRKKSSNTAGDKSKVAPPSGDAAVLAASSSVDNYNETLKTAPHAGQPGRKDSKKRSQGHQGLREPHQASQGQLNPMFSGAPQYNSYFSSYTPSSPSVPPFGFQSNPYSNNYFDTSYQVNQLQQQLSKLGGMSSFESNPLGGYSATRNFVNPLSLLSEPSANTSFTQTHINPLTMANRHSSGRPHSKSNPSDSMAIKKDPEAQHAHHAQSTSPFESSFDAAMPWPSASSATDPIDLIVNAMSSSSDFSSDRPFFLNRRLVKSDVPSLHVPEKVNDFKARPHSTPVFPVTMFTSLGESPVDERSGMPGPQPVLPPSKVLGKK